MLIAEDLLLLLTADDTDFYSRLLGWELESEDTPMGRHVIGVTGAGPAEGMMSPPPGEVGPPPASAVVFGVADVAFDHACRLGATGLQPPTEIPGVEANGACYESLLGWTQGPEADGYRAFHPMVSRSRG
jgi:predicted enzyme related to lactoylglutathione lyase